MRFLTALMIAVAVLFVGCREHTTTPAEIDPPQQVATPDQEQESLSLEDLVFQQILREVNLQTRDILEKKDFDISNPETYPIRISLNRESLPECAEPDGPSSELELLGYRMTVPLPDIQTFGEPPRHFGWEESEHRLTVFEGPKHFYASELDRIDQQFNLQEVFTGDFRELWPVVLKGYEQARTDFAKTPIMEKYERIFETTPDDFGPGNPLGARLFSLMLASFQLVPPLYGDMENVVLYENETIAIITAYPTKFVTRGIRQDGSRHTTTSFTFGGIFVDKKTDSDWQFMASSHSMESANVFYKKLLGILSNVIVERIDEDAPVIKEY